MSVVAGTVVIEWPRAIVRISRSFTHIPKRTAFVPAFWASAWTIARSRSGSALGAGSDLACAIAVCSPMKQRERQTRSKSFVFIEYCWAEVSLLF